MHGEKEVHLALTPIVCHMKKETYLAFQIKSQYNNQKHWAWLLGRGPPSFHFLKKDKNKKKSLCTSPIKVKAHSLPLELFKPTLAGAYGDYWAQ